MLKSIFIDSVIVPLSNSRSVLKSTSVTCSSINSSTLGFSTS
ncbi:uncharacterized protein METZ01_LOCUS26013 [marine metagenome]|uniref:Uncharacterized protein n=1 Tax=marine metagenome TaxID=408172 RepID=A0A381Q4A8_9ZZZZ